MANKIQRIHNYLDNLTIEEVLKYAAQGFEFRIENGHVQAMVMKKEGEADAERV